MISINTNIFGAAVAFLVGVAIAAGNFALSRYILKKHSSKYAAAQIVRQVIQIAYLVILYVFGGYTPWDSMWMLVGGCLGITVPMLWFTWRLVKLSDSLNSKKEESADG